MRIFVPTVIMLGAAFAVYLAVPAAPPKPTETNGERWARMCAGMASPTKRDQKDCVDKFALQWAFEKHSADFDKRLRDASR